jgi:hypothetical protein
MGKLPSVSGPKKLHRAPQPALPNNHSIRPDALALASVPGLLMRSSRLLPHRVERIAATEPNVGDAIRAPSVRLPVVVDDGNLSTIDNHIIHYPDTPDQDGDSDDDKNDEEQANTRDADLISKLIASR